MRRTRLTAAGAAAVIALGGTIAAAEDPTKADQTVTIEVTAAPRSITVGEPVGNLSVTAGATGVEETTTSSLAYNAGPDAAKITAEVKEVKDVGEDVSDWAAELGALTLALTTDLGESDQGDAQTPDAFADGDEVARDLVTGIAANEVVTGKEITYALGGDAPTTARSAFVEITFTITDESGPAT